MASGAVKNQGIGLDVSDIDLLWEGFSEVQLYKSHSPMLFLFCNIVGISYDAELL